MSLLGVWAGEAAETLIKTIPRSAQGTEPSAAQPWRWDAGWSHGPRDSRVHGEEFQSSVGGSYCDGPGLGSYWGSYESENEWAHPPSHLMRLQGQRILARRRR